MSGESRPTARPTVAAPFTPERMGALSDGVFAIVLTLLVLELKLPERDESILTLMRDDARVFAAWLISFVLLARFWLVHHAIVANLQRCQSKTLALNLGFLGAVSLVPFSADTLGTERVEEPWSTVVFAVNVGLVSLTIGLLARHAARELQLHPSDRSIALLHRYQLHYLGILPLVALGSGLLAFAHPVLSVTLLAAELVFCASLTHRTAYAVPAT